MTQKPYNYDIENLLIPAIIFTLFTTQSFTALSSAEAEDSVLIKSITQIEDPRMDVNDLAFFLVTHDFDAVPKRDHVEVRIDDTVYKLVPNGQYPGLANLTVRSS